MVEEIFGPVLSVYRCSSWMEALEIENANPFGNAACIYTSVNIKPKTYFFFSDAVTTLPNE